MRFDKARLNQFHWFEDSQGNMYSEPNEACVTYHSRFPRSLVTRVDRYVHAPAEGDVHFSRLFTGEASWNDKVVLAMVNSGDYTLAEAIVLYATACERCINVLWNTYFPEEGYAEYSEQWLACGTDCEYCCESVATEVAAPCCAEPVTQFTAVDTVSCSQESEVPHIEELMPEDESSVEQAADFVEARDTIINEILTAEEAAEELVAGDLGEAEDVTEGFLKTLSSSQIKMDLWRK